MMSRPSKLISAEGHPNKSRSRRRHHRLRHQHQRRAHPPPCTSPPINTPPRSAILSASSSSSPSPSVVPVMLRKPSSLVLFLRSASPTSFLCTAANTCRPISSTSGRVADLLDILAPLNRAICSELHAKRYVNSLRKCLRSGDHRMVAFLHARLITRGFVSDLLLSNVLMDMYAKLGLMGYCAKLFDGMPERDLISWCTLIHGFVRNGSSLEAFSTFQRMQRAGCKPNHFVISSIFNACSAYGILEPGLLIHGLVIKSGLGFDKFVEVGLVNVYAKCGDLDCALKLFYEIPVKSLVSWNAMISGYFSNGFLIQAVDICRDMCRVGFIMDLVTLRVVTATAAALQMLELCQNLHVYSMKIGLDTDSFVAAELVKLLIKLGDVDYIRKFHRKIKRPDACLYSLLISGYHLHGCREEAVGLCEELLKLNSSLNEGSLISILNLCFCRKEGTQVHTNLLKAGYLSSLSVGNALISMYARFGDMVEAKLAFDNMPVHDIVSWTAIMAGLVQSLQFTRAIEVFYAFKATGIHFDQQFVVTTINACTGLLDVVKGKQIHCVAIKHGFGFSDYINASVINMYAKCGYISSAVRLFSHLSLPHSTILINVMLAAYCWSSQPVKAIDLFGREHHLGFVSDHFSYSIVLNACADMQLLKVGEQIHCCIAKSGFEFSDIIIGNAIINLYVKCGFMASACKFFYSMKNWNAHSYMTLALGYIEDRGRTKTRQVFHQMQHSHLHAKPISFTRIQRDCADSVAVDLGRQIHASIVKLGLDSDVDMGNALVGMYSKSERIDDSKEASNLMMEREDDTQNMFTGHLEDANGGKNLKGFGLYKLNKLRKGTYACEPVVNSYLSANTTYQMNENSAALNVVPEGSRCDIPNGSIVDAYIKCKMLDSSPYVLDYILRREAVLSRSMCNSYDEDIHQPTELHELIKVEKVWDHAVIFILLGNSHLSLLNKRMDYFMSIKKSLDAGRGRAQCMPG